MRIVPPLILILLTIGCGGREEKVSSGIPVILISIDTLRSDRLPAYGYDLVETPAIDAFRSDGVLFEQAWSHYPLTLPSHSSVLTGLLPTEHGVRDNVGFDLSPETRTLAQAFSEEGYATGAAVSAWVLREESGIDRGFEYYDDEVAPLGLGGGIGTVQRAGKDTVDVALEWIKRQYDPIFFFLHLYEPHSPWDAPDRFAARYESPYDAEVGYVDTLVEEFIDGLKTLGIYDDAMIIFFSDHGEGLNDHGEKEHGLFLYREALQVPLIVKLPGNEKAGLSVASPSALIDIAPTVAVVAGVEFSASSHSRSLIDLMGGGGEKQREIYSETYYPRFHMGWSETQSLVAGGSHLIRAPRPELYSLDDDPSETRNLVESERREFFQLSKTLEEMLTETAAPAALSAEEVSKLTALGYLGTATVVADDAVLPDPKDRIESYRKMGEAHEAFRAGNDTLVVEATQSILEENPQMVDILDLRARSFARLGRFDEAVDASTKALQQSPHSIRFALQVGEYLLASGKLEQARQHAELAVEKLPGPSNLLLGNIAYAQDDLASAESFAKEALSDANTELKGNLLLAKVLTKQGRVEEGLDAISTAFEKKPNDVPDLPQMNFVLGDLLARSGQRERAERAFRKEIGLYPASPQAYKNLILLLAEQRRLEEASLLIDQLLIAAPRAASYVAVSDVLRVMGDAKGSRYWARRGVEKFPNDPELRKLARS